MRVPTTVTVFVAGLVLAAQGNARGGIMLGPLQPVPIIADANRQQAFPRIDGDLVAWSDLAGSATSTNDVFGRDIASGEFLTIATGPRYQDTVAVSGGLIVWSDWVPGSNTSADIHGRRFGPSGLGSTFIVTAAAGGQSGVAVDGDVIVWHDNRAGVHGVWGRRLSQSLGSDFQISPVMAYEQSFPDVDGNTVVWMSQGESAADPSNIYGANLLTGAVFPICTMATHQQFPRIDGDHVVWQDWRDGRPRIYARNLLSGVEFAVSSYGNGDAVTPAISGDLVVWMDSRNGTWDVWARYLSDGSPEFPITNTLDFDETWPDVSGDVIVWTQVKEGVPNDIYGALVPEPASAGAVAVLFAGAAMRRRRR